MTGVRNMKASVTRGAAPEEPLRGLMHRVRFREGEKVLGRRFTMSAPVGYIHSTVPAEQRR